MTSHEAVQSWLSEHCIPLVREITFQNGEVFCMVVCILL